jgi:hypothetical protein
MQGTSVETRSILMFARRRIALVRISADERRT